MFFDISVTNFAAKLEFCRVLYYNSFVWKYSNKPLK